MKVSRRHGYIIGKAKIDGFIEIRKISTNYIYALELLGEGILSRVSDDKKSATFKLAVEEKPNE